jgi:hypothetical protein
MISIKIRLSQHYGLEFADQQLPTFEKEGIAIMAVLFLFMPP